MGEKTNSCDQEQEKLPIKKYKNKKGSDNAIKGGIDPYRLYLRDVYSNHEPLTEEREREIKIILLEGKEEDKEKARNELIEKHRPLVLYILAKFIPPKYKLMANYLRIEDQLAEVGELSLVRLAQKFDPSRKSRKGEEARFFSFAFRSIINDIKSYIKSKSLPKRNPTNKKILPIIDENILGGKESKDNLVNPLIHRELNQIIQGDTLTNQEKIVISLYFGLKKTPDDVYYGKNIL